MEIKKENLNKKENVKKIKLIFILILICILIVICIVIFNKNKNKEIEDTNVNIYNELVTQSTENVKVLEDGSKENISTKFKEEKTFEGLIIKDIQFKTENKESIFMANVENKSDKDFKAAAITITFINKNGEEIWQIGSYIEDTLKGGNSKINSTATIDNLEVYDFKIKYKVD